MHVTGGQFKGCKIITPNCAKPTLSKTREAVFSILFSILENFEGKIFLDLFAGSGIMGLEALSRGFRTISVDKNPNAIKIIKKNFEAAIHGVKTSSGVDFQIILKDANKFLETTETKPDVIYLDPPWEMDYTPFVTKIAEKFKNCIIVVEYDKKKVQKGGVAYTSKIAPFKNKVYGRSVLDFIKVD